MVDDENIPIYNAHVCFTGIPIGVITDEKGYFDLKSDDTFKSFEVSFVGMKIAKTDIELYKAFFKILLEEDRALV